MKRLELSQKGHIRKFLIDMTAGPLAEALQTVLFKTN
jgi:hypothetical protein